MQTKFILITALSILLVSAGVVQAEEIDWLKDYEAALAQAEENDSIIMIDVYTDWCHWCKELDKNVFTDDQVISLSKKIVPLKLNAEDNATGTMVAQKFGVQGYPTILFINAEAQEVDRIGGYLPPEKFAAEMERIIDGKGTLQAQMEGYEKGTLAAGEYVSLALHYLQKEDIQQGEEILRAFMEKHPDHPENAQAYAYMTLILGLQKNHEGAEEYLSKLKTEYGDQTELISRAEATLEQIKAQQQ